MTTARLEIDALPAVVRPRGKVRTAGLRWGYFVPAAIVLLVAIIGPLVTPFSATAVVGGTSLAPGGKFLLGTDQNGMDVFSRVIAATRNDVVIALLATIGGTIAGIVVGVVGGMNEASRGIRGFLAGGLARVMDILQAVPAVLIGLVLVALFQSSIPTLIVALVLATLPGQAKLVRTEVLKVRSDAYVDASRMAGEREVFVLLRTVLPNSIRPAIENSSAVFGLAIIVTAVLGFLGVGIAPPTPEWGTMISLGASEALSLRWWGAAFPTVALVFTVSSFAIANTELLRRR
ncbi:ABC transporter permease [Frondihabitans cladoniiphilus]|uniref:ABC transporter permease subunit n=1 Tax=Frondihabitans cladoniiphilus TaxID=715785 RepID=A0ABP8W749_9MICO